MSYDPQLLQRIVEGALLAAGESLSLDRLLSLFEEPDMPEKQEILNALTSLQSACVGRGYELVEVSSGWRFQVVPDLAPWVNRLWEEKPQKYSRALLETLAIIAYRQPITRGDIEEIRGVAVSSHIIKTLAEREWIKVIGHRDVPGRPSLYATTRQFLDYFGLKSLDELPTLGELKDIDSLNQDLVLEDDELVAEREQIAAAKETDELVPEPIFNNSESEDNEPVTESLFQEAASAGVEEDIGVAEVEPMDVQEDANEEEHAENAVPGRPISLFDQVEPDESTD